MSRPQITNRKGPNCELTVRIKFNELDRFRGDYREQISQSRYFIKSNRSKPLGTRLQIIFILEDQGNMEIWTWGVVEEIVSPEVAAAEGKSPGLDIKLMDMTAPRKKQVEQLFGTDEAVEVIKKMYQKDAGSSQETNYVQVGQSARQKQISGVGSFITLAKTADHYDLLGIPKDADEAAIRAGYRDRTRKYHPDQHFRKIPEDMQQELTEVFQKLQTAYRTLSDPTQRAVYDTSINNYANPEAMRNAMPHVQMQKKFKAMYEELVGPRADLIRNLLTEADEAIKVQEFSLARTKLKLASAYDPLNRKLKQRIKEVEELMPSE